MRLFEENNLTIRQAKIALDDVKRMLLDVTIQHRPRSK